MYQKNRYKRVIQFEGVDGSLILSAGTMSIGPVKEVRKVFLELSGHGLKTTLSVSGNDECDYCQKLLLAEHGLRELREFLCSRFTGSGPQLSGIAGSIALHLGDIGYSEWQHICETYVDKELCCFTSGFFVRPRMVEKSYCQKLLCVEQELRMFREFLENGRNPDSHTAKWRKFMKID